METGVVNEWGEKEFRPRFAHGQVGGEVKS